jgi:hypothetical protein
MPMMQEYNVVASAYQAYLVDEAKRHDVEGTPQVDGTVRIDIPVWHCDNHTWHTESSYVVNMHQLRELLGY